MTTPKRPPVIPTEPRKSILSGILIRCIVGAAWASILMTVLWVWLEVTSEHWYYGPKHNSWALAWFIGFVFITAIYIGASAQFGLLNWIFINDED
jgi:hypothetical protein